MRNSHPSFIVDWKALGPCLAEEAAQLVDRNSGFAFQGMNVYGSYDDKKREDERLRRWFSNNLDTFPGVNAIIVPRQKKATGPKCPICHHMVSHCPACGSDMRGTEEKGVDTRIATDMVRLAWEGNYDVSVLVSSDRDFVPVAEFLETKGIKVIHGAFPPSGFHLTQKCWGSIKIPDLRHKFAR